jgi:aerobic-type carbon monoxide dehydrogenase small subunit (CoxS/CutS family)
MMEKTISFRLNGDPVKVTTDPGRMLLWVLRTEHGLTGAKHSCGEGFCGSCTVLVDGEAVLSCQFPIDGMEGKDVLTIEGLSGNGELHPLQEAFMEHNALQCGFCTPGMILKAYELLRKNPRPSDSEIAEALEGHLCRCGSYNRIINAIQTAGRMVRGDVR